MAHESMEEGFKPGDHASTFGGNPFVSTMALNVLEIMEKEGVSDNAVVRGDQLKTGLEELAADYEYVGSPRGRGLMMGLPVADEFDATELMHAAREEGLIVGTAGENTLRFVPPLILTEKNVNRLLTLLDAALDGYEP
jgi:acetylornithine/N-succinyldiaminopimelate aminotransferase